MVRKVARGGNNEQGLGATTVKKVLAAIFSSLESVLGAQSTTVVIMELCRLRKSVKK